MSMVYKWELFECEGFVKFLSVKNKWEECLMWGCVYVIKY